MDEQENILQTAARELPTPSELATVEDHTGGVLKRLIALPAAMKLQEVDVSAHNAHPTRVEGSATFTEADSFLAYVNRHADPARTVVWASFDPRTYKLSFAAVFDEHAKDGTPGWRKHRATYAPAPSVEWGMWTGNNGPDKAKAQFDFALFIENNAADITGTPTEADMLKMATEFQARQDQLVKSAVRLQSGGVDMTYVSTDDAQTVEHMKLFDEFHIAIPVFWGVTTAELLKAKLRYRTPQGKPVFWYELQRPDKAHEQAARDMLQRVRDGIGEVPLLMGSL